MANGIRAAYDVAGKGPDVLMVHGWMASKRYWHEAPKRIPGFRFWAVDLYGFGESEKPANGYDLDSFASFVTAFLDAVKVRKCTIVGHSMGGAIAAWAVMSQPRRFRALCLVDAALAGVVRPPLVWASEPAMRMFMRLADTSRSLGHLTITSMFGVRAPESHVILDDARRADILAASLCGEMMSRPTDWSGLKGVEIPAMMVYGEDDFLVRRGMDRVIESLLPGAEARYIEECGHLPMLEKPEEFYGTLKEFLAKRPRQ